MHLALRIVRGGVQRLYSGGGNSSDYLVTFDTQRRYIAIACGILCVDLIRVRSIEERDCVGWLVERDRHEEALSTST